MLDYYFFLMLSSVMSGGILFSLDCFWVRSTVLRCSGITRYLTISWVGVASVFDELGLRIWRYRVLLFRRVKIRIWKWRVDRKISRKLESRHKRLG